MIASLIDKQDTFELVRDQIAAILKTESESQETLATAEGRDPEDWRLRVFVDRASPWSSWLEAPTPRGGARVDPTPIVNVSLDAMSFDKSSSDVVERQRATGTYHLDCLGYGIGETSAAGGHVAGDAKAASESQRAVRLVRNILMAGEYTYLAMRGTVSGRWIPSIQLYQPGGQDSSVQHVVGARITFEVTFNEFSPQVPPEVAETIRAAVLRAETGEVLVRATYDATPIPPAPAPGA